MALDVRDQQADIWIWDLARETLTRFTFHPGQDLHPTWTPDGRRLVFSSTRAGGPRNLFWQAADGTGAVERLNESPNVQDPQAVSPDGTRLVFKEDSPKMGSEVLVLTMSTPRQAQPLVQTPFDELAAEISPDGRWLAYQSNESGQDEIYVRPFPNAGGGRWQVSTSGGRQPLWARSGQELFYLAPSGALMGVRIERGASFTAGTVMKLFEGRYYGGEGPITGRTYAVSPDGQRFLMIKVRDGLNQTAAPPSIVVVQNWTEELKRLVPTNR